jgi:hypothetical protein
MPIMQMRCRMSEPVCIECFICYQLPAIRFHWQDHIFSRNDANIVNPLNDPYSILNELRANRLLANLLRKCSHTKGLSTESRSEQICEMRDRVLQRIDIFCTSRRTSECLYTTGSSIGHRNMLMYDGIGKITVYQHWWHRNYSSQIWSQFHECEQSRLWEPALVFLQNNTLATVTGSGHSSNTSSPLPE